MAPSLWDKQHQWIIQDESFSVNLNDNQDGTPNTRPNSDLSLTVAGDLAASAALAGNQQTFGALFHRYTNKVVKENGGVTLSSRSQADQCWRWQWSGGRITIAVKVSNQAILYRQQRKHLRYLKRHNATVLQLTLFLWSLKKSKVSCKETLEKPESTAEEKKNPPTA